MTYNEPRHEKNFLGSFGPGQTQSVLYIQPQKMARGLKFFIYEVSRDCAFYVAETKALISCTVSQVS